MLALLYYGWTWSYQLADFGGDNATYLLTARQFSPWATPDTVAAYFASQSQYPPLYPLVLAIFGGGSSVLIAHLITTTALLLAFVVFYFWSRRLDFTQGRATAAVVLFAMLPGTYMHALSILSENLYLLLTLLSFFAIASYETDRKQDWLWTAAVAVACAALTRSVGICLIAAFFLYLALHRPPRFWLLGLVAVAPMLAWQVSGQQTAPGYLSSLLEQYSSEPLAALLDHLSRESRMLWIGWVGNFSWSPIGAPVMAAVGGICLLGAVVRLWQRKLDGLYVALYFLLILIWPYPAEASRFLLVLIPVLLVQGALLIDSWRKLKNVAEARFYPSLVLFGAVAIIAAPSLLLTAQRFFLTPPEFADLKRTVSWYAIDPQEASYGVLSDKLLIDHIKSIDMHTEQTDCVYSIKPSIIGFYANRIAVIPPRLNWDSAAADAYLDRTRCRFFYLMSFASPSFPSVYYPLERLRDRLTIVSAAGRASDYPAGLLATYKTGNDKDARGDGQ